MSIVFLSGGLLTTVQDLGRSGFRGLGINPGGAMDQAAVRLINILLGNDENEAVLEIHFPAPRLLFEKDAVIALGGADFAAQTESKPINNWETVLVRKGETLTFTAKPRENRLYLSVRGGFRLKKWLGSNSTNLKAQVGGFEGRKLEKNDRLDFKLEKARSKSPLKISSYSLPRYGSDKIRIIRGAEFGLLTPFSSENLLRQKFTISSDSDRMGYRLQGEPLYLLHEKEMISSAVTFGTIQLLPDGKMIILMADHQTTGGYPRIGNVVAADLPILAQLGTNDKISFALTSLEETEQVALKFENDLNFLKTGVKLNGFY